MGQGALFAFGGVIFFIVTAGGFLYAAGSIREAAKSSR